MKIVFGVVLTIVAASLLQAQEGQMRLASSENKVQITGNGPTGTGRLSASPPV